MKSVCVSTTEFNSGIFVHFTEVKLDYPSATPTSFRILASFFDFNGSFWGQVGLETILNHTPQSCFDISSYGAIWTHFRSNSSMFEQIRLPIIIYIYIYTTRAYSCTELCEQDLRGAQLSCKRTIISDAASGA